MISREAAEQAAKERRDREVSYLMWVYSGMTEAEAESKWKESTSHDDITARYLLQPPPASPDLASGRGTMTVEKCLTFVRKCRKTNDFGTPAHDIDALAAELMDLVGVASDDGEPVTEEWLRSIGFYMDHWLLDKESNPPSLCLDLWWNIRLAPCGDNGFELMRLNKMDFVWESELDLPHIKTRNAVRQLLAALGIGTQPIGVAS